MSAQILFLDVNGTILDDWGVAFEALAVVLDHFGVPRPTIEEYVYEVGVDGDYRGFYQRRGIHSSRAELYAMFLPAYKAHLQELRLMPGVHDALHKMKDAGTEIHILTAARKDFIEPMLVSAGVHDLCDSWHYHIHDKSEQVRAVIDGSDIRPDKCVMVGDLPSDVRFAKQAGIKGVGFCNPHVPKDAFKELYNMDYFALSFAGLADYVCNI